MARYNEDTQQLIVDNYIYLHHLDEYILIPQYPENIQDSMTSTFQSTNALARSAPVFSYSNSGPRQVTIQLNLHREMLDDVNYMVNPYLGWLSPGEDTVDALIRKLQSISLPKYSSNSKSVEPPMITVRFGNEIYTKGIVNGNIQVGYDKPILSNGKYAQVQIGFTITEIDPYDAQSVADMGGFRAITSTFKNGIY